MRFEIARVLETIESLRALPTDGADEQETAAEFVAHRFERLGLQVDRTHVAGSRFPEVIGPCLGYLAAAVGLTAGVILAWRSQTPGLAVFLGVSGLLTLIFVQRYGFRWGWMLSPRGRAPLIVARHSEALEPPRFRVVYQAILGPVSPAFPPGWPAKLMLLLGGLLAVYCAAVGRESPVLVRVSGLVLAGSLWIAVWLQFWCRLRGKSSTPSPHDFAGLALMLELARSWPRSKPRGIEVVFVAAGGQCLDFAGTRAYFKRLQTEQPPRPSLPILFFSPGHTTEIQIACKTERNLAASAAAGLWIPHRLPARPRAILNYWPLGSRVRDFIALMSVGLPESARNPVNSESLARTGQLATEIALRWFRREAGRTESASNHEPDRNASRSVQNPG